MPKNKKHIVIISPWFPPHQSVAVNRINSFAKYLDKNKFSVTILTLHKEGAKEEEIVHECAVYRLKNNSFLKLPTFSSKDSKVKHKAKVVWKLLILKLQKNPDSNWIKNTSEKLATIHNKKSIDLIISSFAPVSPHLVTLNFLNKYPEVKWIADMRDEMSLNHQISLKEKKYLQKIEEKIEKKANAITTVSLPIVNYFKTLHPKTKYIEEIRNGFDNDLKIENNTYNKYFTMLYAGNFYGKIKPYTFFEALSNIKNELPKNWKLQFLGTKKNFSFPAEFKNNIEFISRVPQDVSIKYMQKSDLNIMIHPIIKRKGIFTGKLFDYLAVKKPILGIIDTQDVAAKLIKELNMGFVADFDDITGIEIAIKNCIKVWKTKTPLNFDEKGIEKLHRKYQVKKMEVLIDKIFNEKV